MSILRTTRETRRNNALPALAGRNDLANSCMLAQTSKSIARICLQPDAKCLCQLARILAQKFGCAFHVFLLGHSRARVLVNTVKNFAKFSIFRCTANNCEHWLSELSCQSRHAGWRFPFERLPIQTPLACNHQVRIFHLRFKPDCFRDNFESRPDCRAAKTQQTKAEAACGTRTRFVPIVEPEFCGHDVREPRQRAFQIVEVAFPRPFLWTKHSRRAIFA